MFLPKRNIACVVAFLLVFANFSIFAYTSIDTSTLYEQLCKLNKEWKTKQFNDPIFFQKITFNTDEELIQTHLKLVEQKLREKNIDHLPEDVQKTRLKNLDILQEYWKTSLFPKNLYHKERTPYFIDDYGTACAVGYLVIKAGNEEFAQKIQQENNYAYISELNAQYPALIQWADANGFTIDELAWIQPGYCSGPTCSPGTQQNISCNGLCDGCAEPPTPAWGVAPYTYVWDSFSGLGCDLCAGTYNCTITDAVGTSQVYTFVITEPPPLIITISSITPSTCGFQNGAACVAVIGGSPPYVIQWTDPDFTIGPCIDSVFAGCYNPVVVDANGCQFTMPVCINDIAGPTIDSIITTDVPCAGDTATAYVSGGTYPYTYVWYPDIGGQCTSCDTTVPTFNVDLSTQADTIWISPDVVRNGFCCGADSISKCIRFNVTVHSMTEQIAFDFYSGAIPPGALFYQIGCGAPQVVGESVCIYGATNFCITFCKPGNNTNEYYITAAGTCTSTQTDSIAIGLTAGTHVVSVTDANGCTAIDSVAITETPPLAAFIDSVANIDCFGNCNGFAHADATGGTPPYTYLWDDTLSQVTDTAIGLCAGTYCVTVMDANGCLDSACVTITEPPPLYSAIFASDINCFSACDGSATAVVGGGIMPYAFFWSPSNQTTATADSLCAGLYSVIVEDSLGCVDTSSILIGEPTLLQITPIVIDVSCFGDTDGAICMNVVGGTPFYSYVWSPPVGNLFCVTNLPAGTYCFTVTDVSGCTADTCVTVNEPSLLIAVGSTVPSTCGNANGVAVVSPSGGTLPYTYIWDDPNFQTNDTAIGLFAGCYNVLITDANGCTRTIPVCVGDVPGPIIDSVIAFDFNGYNVDCYGNFTGSATAFVSSGLLPYTYSWNTTPLQDSITATGLAAGIYIVTVTDLNGCIAIDSVIINEPDILEVITFGDATICSGDTAQISFAIFGGVAPYVVIDWCDIWFPPPCIVLPDTTTTYTAWVTDANGCTDSGNVTVTIYPPLSSSVTASSDTICTGASSTLTASVSGGNGGPYTYTWLNDGSMGSTITVSPATDSTFTVVVSDGGCSVNDTTSAIVVVEICSGISEFEVQRLNFIVYPNPSRGVFTIEINHPITQSPNHVITIYDVLGREILESSIVNRKSKIDFSKNPAGVYHLQLVTDEGIGNKKIILE